MTNDSRATRPMGPAFIISRRSACGMIAGAAAVTLPSTASYALAAAPSAGRTSIRYVLTDKNYPESLEFALPFQRRGVRRLEITDGLTKLWRDALLPLWRERGGAVVGLTRRETWACVAEQARSEGRRSVLYGHHAVSARGGVTDHYLSGQQAVLAGASALTRCGSAWPTIAAGIAMECSAESGQPHVSRHFAELAGRAEHVPSFFLASWVIA